jgi:hypothetical protein
MHFSSACTEAKKFRGLRGSAALQSYKADVTFVDPFVCAAPVSVKIAPFARGFLKAFKTLTMEVCVKFLAPFFRVPTCSNMF